MADFCCNFSLQDWARAGAGAGACYLTIFHQNKPLCNKSKVVLKDKKKIELTLRQARMSLNRSLDQSVMPSIREPYNSSEHEYAFNCLIIPCLLLLYLDCFFPYRIVLFFYNLCLLFLSLTFPKSDVLCCR